MSNVSGSQYALELRDNLHCPQCQYSLRGLPGPDIRCPECGRTWQSPELIAQFWKRKWWHVPAFTTVCLPGFFLFLALIVLFLASVIVVDSHAMSMPVFIAVYSAAMLAGWTYLCIRAVRIFGSSFAIAPIAVGHLAMVSLMAGAFAIFSSIILLLDALMGPSASTASFVLVFLAGLCLLMLGRAAERWIARLCLHQFIVNVVPTAAQPESPPSTPSNPHDSHTSS
ncbi:MAG TPA: hypothetical protein VG711_01795 [Phycisphaerales bacterium]|nr:hypothetical protein [Phycisphaerales bacterium]